MSRLVLPLLFASVLVLLGSLPNQVHSNSTILSVSPKVRREAEADPAGGGKFARPFGGNTRRQTITRRRLTQRRKLRNKGLAQRRKLRNRNRGKRSPLPFGRGKFKRTSGVNTRRQLTLKRNFKNKGSSPRKNI